MSVDSQSHTSNQGKFFAHRFPACGNSLIHGVGNRSVSDSQYSLSATSHKEP